LKVINFIKKEFLFFCFFFLLVVLSFKYPKEINNYYDYISWPTIRALFILLLLTTAIKLSNFFDIFAYRILPIFKNERNLALFFISFTAILSMFLTNDITLFIVVPITLALSNIIENDLNKLIFFEAISANVGSLLTPIGNPQNLYLFREWDISFFSFIHAMFPIFILKFIVLLIFVFIFFKNISIKINTITTMKIDKFLFISSIIFFITFIFSLEFDFVRFLIPILVIWFIFFKKDIFYSLDWFLIFTFILMFIDFSVISKIDFIKTFIESLNLDFFNTLNITIILSQIMSNVPSTIFMSNFSNDFLAIGYGANIAGSSLILASLANIIAVRMLNNPKEYLRFHKYSIPYFFVSYFVVIFYLNT